MGYFAKSPIHREEYTIHLDSTIGENDEVRLLDALLRLLDWSEWEEQYHGARGQPPIHPRILAAIVLFGLFRGFRSSRLLEYLCQRHLQFIWLAEGHTPDHSTICDFRKKFRTQLKALFRQIGLAAKRMGAMKIGKVAFDGTRTKANNNRAKTDTAKKLEEQLQQLEQELEKQLDEWFEQHPDTPEGQAAKEEEEAMRSLHEPTLLPKELEDLKNRQAELKEALEQVQQADEARQRQGINPEKNPAQRCRTDPDAKVMPNKEGGYAPNYTPMVGVSVGEKTEDGETLTLIVYANVLEGVDEHTDTLAAADQINADFGQEGVDGERVEQFLADSLHGTGVNMEGMEKRGIEFFTPCSSSEPQPGNPAFREDPTQPVPEDQWDALPRNPKGQLDKSAFVYDAEQDVYYCAMGKVLEFEKPKTEERQGITTHMRVYRCADCSGCPLAAMCLDATNKRGRTISRDEYAEVREQTAARMGSEEGKKTYSERFHAAESVIGILKAIMGIRQFLHRGSEDVQLEWLWGCTSFNLKKLIRWLAKVRSSSGGDPLLKLRAGPMGPMNGDGGGQCAPHRAARVFRVA
jgi:transposase